MKAALKSLALCLAAGLVLSLSNHPAAAQSSAIHRWHTPKAYARHLVLERWHTTAQWEAENAIIAPESGWNRCAVYPGQHLCAYSWPAGTPGNSCGVAQRTPCLERWRGRLGAAWRDQVRDLQAYIAGRYGSPVRALAFRRANGWY